MFSESFQWVFENFFFSGFSEKRLVCCGRACSSCGLCRDWYYKAGFGYEKNYRKRADASCTGVRQESHYRDSVNGFFPIFTDATHHALRTITYTTSLYLAGSTVADQFVGNLCSCPDNTQ